ncbi:kinase-like domain-containing protein [Rhizophagus irregularis DAOM 181602=DAOM 197198]|nr:kinase-like domain-containing protein [Rhizophagus irregularis DAOM 181602=DAOM 197198]
MEEMLRKRGKIIIGVVGVVTIPFTIPILTYIVLRDVVQEVKKKTKKVKRDIEIWSLEQTLKLQLELELKKFIYEQSKVQKDIGLKPSDAGFCEWLKDVKKVKIDCVLTNCKQELQAEYEKYLTTGTQELPSLNIEAIDQLKSFNHCKLFPKQEWIVNKLIPNAELNKRYKSYGLCLDCQQPKIDEFNCQTCGTRYLIQYFKELTSSSNPENEIIKKFQSDSPSYKKALLKRIPYNKFESESIEYLGRGGFSTIFKAIMNEYNDYYDYEKDDEKVKNRSDYIIYRKVVLKKLKDSSNAMTVDFLQEVANHHKLFKKGDKIVKCYGITQDHQKDYVMVMEYMDGGDLRQCLKKHANNISDLGFCRPVNESDKSKVYGVTPYIAPEVLRHQPYTQASDIYSFGVIAYELFWSKSPYYDKSHDEFLAIEICKGLRPNLDDLKFPQVFKNLIRQCWNADPAKRPTSDKLEKTLRDWQKDTEFLLKLQEISQDFTYKSHPTAITTI